MKSRQRQEIKNSKTQAKECTCLLLHNFVAEKSANLLGDATHRNICRVLRFQDHGLP
jgi:hypothetical protein